MPPGMRDTLYFKDDDARLSFQGNYITLTNMKEHDLFTYYKKIICHLSIFRFRRQIQESRVKMLHNRFAGKIMETLNRLRDADIEMNGQIVLMQG